MSFCLVRSASVSRVAPSALAHLPTVPRSRWHWPSSAGSAESVARALADRAAELKRKRERLLDLAEDGLIGGDDLARRLAAAEDERRTVEGELARVRRELSSDGADTVMAVTFDEELK